MRKTLIALILVLPMVFVLVIFTATNEASLGVNIAVNGINIIAEGRDAEGTLFLDMADKTEHIIMAEVTPNNATEKGYTLTSSDETVAEVSKDGKLLPKRQGTVEIIATSNDKNFTDSLPVVIVATKPYDFDFTLAAVGDGETSPENVLEKTEEGYAAEVPAGEYHYGISIAPAGFTAYDLKEETGTYAEIEKGAKTLLLPFSGEAVFGITVPDGVRGDIQKTLRLNVTKPENTILINGQAIKSGQDMMFWDTKIAYGTREVQLYLECNGNFSSFTSENARVVESHSLKNGRYILTIALDEIGSESGVKSIGGILKAGGETCTVTFTFTDFEFSLYSDVEIVETENGKHATLFTDKSTSFYAVTSGGAKGVKYEWTFEGPAEYLKSGTLSVPDDMVTLTPRKDNEELFLHVKATYGSEERTLEVTILAVKEIGVIQIKNNTKADLAECYTVAGLVYADGMTKTADNTYPLQVYSHSTAGGTDRAGEEVVYSVKALTGDTPAAMVEMRKGVPTVVPTGTGKVEITAAWKHNETFGQNVSATVTLNIVKDAVAVKTAPELTKATEEGRAVVLMGNIKLGTDANGNVLPDAERKALLQSHRMKSTYNTEWYKYAANYSENDAYISYVMEFKNDVYGNGKSIDADNFTHAVDNTGSPSPFVEGLYNGPLHFVTFRGIASVAGQDNCAFLVRTNGVKLYGVNLLGCSDSSLLDPETKEYNLARLNLTGTTLEVNADCEIVNCRIRNGRNVVRIYGGNRDGNKYFIDSLASNPAGVTSERIHVSIDGCILSHGREFILKIGANRALRASNKNGREPALTDQSGKAYPETGASNRYGNLYNDAYFYSHYVMTDVTLKDSVLETSGLFTVGMESNFSGQYLYDGSDPKDSYYQATKEWQHSGGTSFAAVLRLVGDVRLYDWKDFSLVDASTLIEATAGNVGDLSEGLKLDLKKMIELVTGKMPDYADVIESLDGKEYVHGGIALYGGGRNYSAVDFSKLGNKSSSGADPGAALNDFMFIGVNINVLQGGQGVLDTQGTILPKAAGTRDFNFYMYGKNSANNYLAQLNDEQKGLKYFGVAKLPAFV